MVYFPFYSISFDILLLDIVLVALSSFVPFLLIWVKFWICSKKIHEICQFSSKWNVRIYIVRTFYFDLRNILTPYCGEATTKRRRLQPRCWCYSLRHKILISKAVLKEDCSEIHAIVKNESGQSSLRCLKAKQSSPFALSWILWVISSQTIC